MKTSILALAMGVALACPTATHANENRNIFEQLFFGSDFSHRAHDETVVSNRATRSYPAGSTG
jgi:hypothetical protein